MTLYMTDTSFIGREHALGWQTGKVVHLYVRSTDGDDNNQGVFQSKPLATLAGAYSKIQYLVNHTVIIHVGAHSGNGYALPIFQNHIMNAHVIVVGDGAGEAGDGVTVLLSDTAQAGSDNYNVVVTGPLGVDAYVGKTIRITSGAALGDRRTIKRNTAVSIEPCAPFSDFVVATDTFVIEEPSISLEIENEPTVARLPLVGIPDNDSYLKSNQAYGLAFVNFNLHGVFGSMISSGALFLYGCEGNGWQIESNGICCAGMDSSALDVPTSNIGLALGAPNEYSYAGWGITLQTKIYARGFGFNGYAVSTSGNGLYIPQPSNVRFFGGRALFIDSENNYNPLRSTLSILPDENTPFVIDLDAVTGFSPIHCHNMNAVIRYTEVNNVGAQPGIFAELDSWVEIEGCTGTCAGIGVQTNRGAIVRCVEALGISGTVGDFSEDNGTTPRAAAALLDETYFVDATKRSRIFRSDAD